MLEEIDLADSVRTPFGSFGGAFADVSADELGKSARRVVRREAQDVKELFGREHPRCSKNQN
jgi:acetyl-CoA acetyltransferase